MLKEAELDRFLDEFFDGTMPVQSEEKNTDESTEDLEEYTLPTDGLIIRQMKRDGKVSRRTWAALALMVIIVPVILYLSVRIFHGRRYMVCSLIVVVAAMLPFFMMFEGRKPKAREIMVISVLAAIGVAGRAAFFMLPSFKPIAAIVVLTGVSFGGEAGFLVGCMIMMISNIFMGHGPWTPWQMFALGLLGFISGLVFRKDIRTKTQRALLCLYGALSTFFIYGGIMDSAYVLMAGSEPTLAALLAAYASGLPFNLIFAGATVVFLLVLTRPILNKLRRIKKKYGLLTG